MDLDLGALLGYRPAPVLFPSPALRLLKSGNPELVDRYVTKLLTYYESHDMIGRIDKLHDDFGRLKTP
jgi:hypothetical protein